MDSETAQAAAVRLGQFMKAQDIDPADAIMIFSIMLGAVVGKVAEDEEELHNLVNYACSTIDQVADDAFRKPN